MKTTMTSQDARTLADLRSVGPATVDDLRSLGIHTVEDLSKCDAEYLYARICETQGGYIDRCVEDVFSCAIAQARNPELPAERCDWWWWSRARKEREHI